jgi:phenolic acid decarboxylase
MDKIFNWNKYLMHEMNFFPKEKHYQVLVFRKEDYYEPPWDEGGLFERLSKPVIDIYAIIERDVFIEFVRFLEDKKEKYVCYQVNGLISVTVNIDVGV